MKNLLLGFMLTVITSLASYATEISEREYLMIEVPTTVLINDVDSNDVNALASRYSKNINGLKLVEAKFNHSVNGTFSKIVYLESKEHEDGLCYMQKTFVGVETTGFQKNITGLATTYFCH